jgi:hypothetical protein
VLAQAKVASDTASGADTASLEQGQAVTGSDTATGSDNVTGRAYTLADVGAGAEGASALSAARSASDAASGADSTSALARAVADTGAGAESVGERALTVADLATGGDASVLQSGNERNASESAAGTDTITLVVAIAGSDVGAGVDAAIAGAAHVGSDAGSGADAAIGPNFSESRADVGIGVDTATLTIGAVVPVSPSTALEIAIRDMLAAAIPSSSVDDSSAMPDLYDPDTLYLWEASDSRRPQGVSTKRHEFEFQAVYAAPDLGEEARMQNGDRAVTNALDSRLSAMLAAIRASQHTTEWSNLTVRVDPDFMANYGARGFMLRINGYRLE